MVGVVVFAQTPAVREKDKDDFKKMSFEVALNKDSYLPFEPILAKFRFSNQTEFAQTTYNPVFLQESKIRINFNDKITEYNTLSLITSKPFRLPAIYQPGHVYEQEELLSTMLGVFFPEPGNYEIQFILSSSDAAESIASNSIHITIENPTGIDKEAYDFLKKHEKFAGLFAWASEEKNGVALLENFVSRYGESNYGNLAIYNLGVIYQAKDELDKAQIEFEKVKSGNNKIIADSANKALSDIAKRKIYLEKLKQPN
jgi:hypothetical protein